LNAAIASDLRPFNRSHLGDSGTIHKMIKYEAVPIIVMLRYK